MKNRHYETPRMKKWIRYLVWRNQMFLSGCMNSGGSPNTGKAK